MRIRQFRPYLIALTIAALTLLLGFTFVRSLELQHVGEHREDAARLVNEYGRSLQMRIDRGLDAGRVVAAILEQQEGDLGAVDTLATEVTTLHGGVSMLGLAPDYVLTHIYPLEGNEAALGLELMAQPLRRSQVRAALQRGTIGLSGPQMLATGKPGLVSDVPVTINGGDVGNWGVVTVAFEVADLLTASNIDGLLEAGYDYRLVAELPGGDAFAPLVIASPAGIATEDAVPSAAIGSLYDLVDPVAATISIPQGEWLLYISPVAGWEHDIDGRFERGLVILVALFVALFTFDIARRPELLRRDVNRATRELARMNRQLQGEIATRLQVENALRQSESRALSILRNAADAILSVDAAGDIRDCNPAAGRIFGYRREDILGQPVASILPDYTPTHADEWFADVEPAEGGQVQATTVSLTGQNQRGEALDLVVAVSRVMMQQGWLYTLILRDHTAENRAQNALRETRRQLDYVISRAPVVVFVLDENGVFVLSEGRGLARIGRAPGEAVGHSIFDIYPNSPEIHRAVRATLRGEPQTLVFRLGRTVFDIWYSPRFDDEGRVVGVFGVASDVTELKEAEEALLSVLNTVADGVVTADPMGKIVMANRRMADIFGCDPAELVGRRLTELFSSTMQPQIDQCLADLRTGRAGALMPLIEVEGMHADGHRIMLEMHLAQTQVGEQQQFTASIHDISKQKELAQMRDDFIATVSHELRSPLAAMIGWLDTLLEERPGPLNPEQRRFLKIAMSGADRLNNLVEEILTVARISEGTLHLRLAPFDPAQLVANTVAMLTPLAALRSQRLEIVDQWPAAQMVNGDRYRLEQVITNLINNAIKFSTGRGTITIHSMVGDGQWRLEVRDQGIGIPEAEVGRLYERFYRATNVRNTHMQGTGLGLFVSKSIIEAHHGTIGHRNLGENGHGTVAWFTVPVEPLEGETTDEVIAELGDRGGGV